MRAQGWAEAEKAKAQRKPAAMREHEQIFGQAPREAVQEFPLEIHKSLPSNGLRISSLIKVVSLLARTYGKKRRILGQPPRQFTVHLLR